MWVKTKIAGPHGKRRAWAIPYRGFLIVRHGARHFAVAHIPSGRALPASPWGDIGHDTRLGAKWLIDCIHTMTQFGSGFVSRTPFAPLDPSLPIKEFKALHGELVREAVQGFTFGCGPDLEEALMKLTAERRKRKGLPALVEA